MSYIICHLCRGKVEINPSEEQPRCPKCGAKIPPKMLENLIATAQLAPQKVACASCLGTFATSAIGALNTCPHCGHQIVNDEAQKLYKDLEGLEDKVRSALLSGLDSAQIVAEIMPTSATEDARWAFFARIIADLPFYRFQIRQKQKLRLPSFCDICGLKNDKLIICHAKWEIDPKLLQRYRKSNYGGFEGDFLNEKNYLREALYCLCPSCLKKIRQPDFANGYPAKTGYLLTKYKKLKEFPSD